jgi:hydrogenase/urease accessory protein HupE
VNWPTLLVAVLIPFGAPAAADAHELRPAYLEIRQTEPDRFAVWWKVPALGDRRLSLTLRMPDNCRAEAEPLGLFEGGAHHERSVQVCEGGLAGRAIAIDGLNSTFTDALVRISWAGGAAEVYRLRPDMPRLTVQGAPSTARIAATYFRLGVDHILSGTDHLLFVFALMLLIRTVGMLVRTITAFTLAHSITLSAAALGYVGLPQPPVEAVIALSIVFVARELAEPQRDEGRLSERYPWLVAFVFGLLHGFGFAGALTSIGLPPTDLPLALLTFNAGVEAGQLLFVGGVLVAKRVLLPRGIAASVPLREVGAYGIGTLATWWMVTRLMAFA